MSLPRATALATFASLLALAALAALAAEAEQPLYGAALPTYVAKPDASYTWKPVGRYARKGAMIVGLHLVSQTWRDTVWQHQLYLIRPERIDSAAHGVLIVGGGRWHESYAAGLDENELWEEIGPFVEIARRMRAVVAVVGQVPFQPIFDMTEDRLIAHTLDRYLATHDPEWPLLLPMVKSAIRAMDAAQEAAAREWGIGIDTFTVLGASKRGWTAWLTAAMDARVTAVVPIVIDAVEMRFHFTHEIEVWGAPSEEIQPYTDLNLHSLLSSEEGRELREIVDPFSYRELLVQPKLIVIATNDRYFPLDSLNLYWDALVGRKYVLYVPNNGHEIADLAYVIRSAAALNRDAADVGPLPTVDWEFKRANGDLALCMAAEPAPTRVRVWIARAPTRDFRAARWEPRKIGVSGRELGAAQVRLPLPASGYAAVFGELEFGRRSEYSLSTNVAVFGGPGLPPSTPLPRGTPGTCPPGIE
ncbi:MAG TPA: PhoPQ-activated protein PqaA family protein [Gammaproteobacteria bacterium]